MELLSLIFETVGVVFIAYAALRVHHRVLAEHKIDKKVFKTMRIEQFIGWTGVALVIIGFVINWNLL